MYSYFEIIIEIKNCLVGYGIIFPASFHLTIKLTSLTLKAIFQHKIITTGTLKGTGGRGDGYSFCCLSLYASLHRQLTAIHVTSGNLASSKFPMRDHGMRAPNKTVLFL